MYTLGRGVIFHYIFFLFFIRYVSLIAAPSTFGTVCIIIIIYIYTRVVPRPPACMSPYSSIAYIVVKSRPAPRLPAGIGIILVYFLTPRPSPESKLNVIIIRIYSIRV